MPDKQTTSNLFKFGTFCSGLLFASGTFMFNEWLKTDYVGQDFVYYRDLSISLGSITISFFTFLKTIEIYKNDSFFLDQYDIYPRSPWKWKKDWSEGKILNLARNTFVFRIAILITFFILSPFLVYLKGFSFIQLINDISNGVYSIAYILVFSLFNLIILFAIKIKFYPYIREILQNLLHGRSVIKFNNPIKAGAENTLKVLVPKKFTGHKLKAVLRCQEVTSVTNRDGTFEKLNILWEADATSIARSHSQKSSCRFLYDIKEQLPSSTYGSGGIQWEVHIESGTYKTSFVIPVESGM